LKEQEGLWDLQIKQNLHKILYKGVFWNWWTNESYRSWIPDSIRLDLPMLSLIFYYKNWNLKFKIPPKFDHELNINLLGVRFVGMGLKCDTLDVVIFWIFFVA
jgi:hypothetical protein